jgi:hypothetical protein
VTPASPPISITTLQDKKHGKTLCNTNLKNDIFGKIKRHDMDFHVTTDGGSMH